MGVYIQDIVTIDDRRDIQRNGEISFGVDGHYPFDGPSRRLFNFEQK